MGAKLKFGDVIRFAWGDGYVTAMVVLLGPTDVQVQTDEGTVLWPESAGRIAVLGLANTDSDDSGFYHEVGKTATFDTDGPTPYEVLS